MIQEFKIKTKYKKNQWINYVFDSLGGYQVLPIDHFLYFFFINALSICLDKIFFVRAKNFFFAKKVHKAAAPRLQMVTR